MTSILSMDSNNYEYELKIELKKWVCFFVFLLWFEASEWGRGSCWLFWSSIIGFENNF